MPTHSRLDERDLQILTILAEHGRITKAELAERVNLSAPACWERLKRIEDSGVIRGFRADIALDGITPHVVVFVMAELASHTSESFERFENALHDVEQVVACWALGGGFDYLLQVVCRDIDAYQLLIDQLLAQDIGLVRYFSYVVTKDVKHMTAPPLKTLLATAEPNK